MREIEKLISKKEKLITVGEVLNTQGHKGEVKVRPLTDFPERFTPNAVLLLEKNGQYRPLTVEKARSHKNLLVIKFKEIPDMNSAEEIKGTLLKITRDQLAELPGDSYFIFEIIGMEVVTAEGQLLGRVKDVMQTGSNDVYIVTGQTKDYLIPALKKIITQIDKENQRMVIEPLEGLLDL